MKTNADEIIRILENHGIDAIFGISGGFILPLFQATADTKCRLIATRNEQGASFMADAYARAKGHAGCCISTSGPGATNLMTGVAGSFADSVPMLVITGQVATKEFGKGGIQEGSGFNHAPSIMEMFRPITKKTYRVEADDDMTSVVIEALLLAESGRPGPVHLEIPIDVLTAPFSATSKPVQFASVEPIEFQALDQEVEAALALIKTAKKPVILAGAGCTKPELFKKIRQVQALHEIPVATSLGGKGIVDEANPLSLGMIGCYGQDVANEYILKEADLIIAMGVSFQYLTSISWNQVFKEKPLIHIDIDKRELGKNFTPTVKIQGSALFLLDKLLLKGKTPLSNNVVAMKSTHGFYPANRVMAFGGQSESYLNPGSLGRELSNALTLDDDVVIDSGENAYWSMYSIRVQRPSQLFVNAGWGSMGYGAAAPVGVAAARNGKGRVFSTIGDGGFLMNATELLTGVQIEAPITWIILDNRGYGTQKHWQRDWFNGRYIGTELPPTNFSLFAESMGIPSFQVRTPEEFRKAIADSRKLKGCSLIWAHVDPAIKPPQALGSTLKK